jgi:hypothetical protein
MPFGEEVVLSALLPTLQLSLWLSRRLSPVVDVVHL